MNKRLRIGLLIDSYLIPAWAFKMLEDIILSKHSQIVLIVKKKTAAKPNKSFLNKVYDSRNTLFFTLLEKLDNRLFKNIPNAFELKDIRKIINCDEIEVSTKETKFSDKVEKDDVDRIISCNIDVFIRLGFRILRGEILRSSKYGVWSYHHGDNAVNRGGPAGAWEVLQGWKETGVFLQVLTEDLDGGIKLAESFSATDPLSINRNRNNLYWGAVSILPTKLQQLYSLGETDFFKKIKVETNPYFYYNRLFLTPNNILSFRYLLMPIVKKISSIFMNLFYFEQWVILFKIEKENKMSTSFFRFKKIIPPKDRFWADPFVIEKNESYYIFIEELIYKENKGKISVIEMDKTGNYSSPKVVLEKDCHLSYPFLFEDNNELYMIPETAQNKTIEMYRCIDFPMKWELCKVLMTNVYAVDTTILKKDNKYWLFCNIRENEGGSSADKLFLFSSNNLLTTEWAPHPNSPIISDVKKSRPAGNIFSVNGKLYRPSQNCAKRYGHGMTINEIVELNDSTYNENTLQSIYPNWEKRVLGSHTLNHAGGLTVIDALIRRRK